MDIYMKALSDAAVMTTAKDQTSRKRAYDDFYRLYTGPMVFVEDEQVSHAMVKLMSEYQVENSDQSLEFNNVLSLGTVMRLSYFETLKLKPEDVLKRQEDYRPDKR